MCWCVASQTNILFPHFYEPSHPESEADAAATTKTAQKEAPQQPTN